jgi:hypothetical protein
MWRHRRTRLALIGAILSAAAVGAWISRDREPGDSTLASREQQHEPARASKEKVTVSVETRAMLLTRAHLWREPDVPIDRASFRHLNLEEVTCHFKVSNLGGTSPKFDCVLDSGEEIRVKYGNGPEVPAEAAATRLLRTLGFGADNITLVRRLRCYGCPEEPFSTVRAVEVIRAEPLLERVIDDDDYEDFEWVALERKFDAAPIETEHLEGWSFFELDTVDEQRGGAPRAHIDALRLVAVLLAHWDNKSENQRLVCLGKASADDPCDRPFLLLQDVGATFGPNKVDLDAWSRVPLWEDRAQCTVSMRELPFDGATFGRATITERGRRFIADRISQLSEAQLADLFESARFSQKRGFFAPTHDVADWVRVFKAKVQAITDGPPCPTA